MHKMCKENPFSCISTKALLNTDRRTKEIALRCENTYRNRNKKILRRKGRKEKKEKKEKIKGRRITITKTRGKRR